MMDAIQQFADAMASVGQAIEARFEREQVEWVLGLTGGELENEPLHFRAPTKYSGEQDGTCRYWYEGVPEWAAREDFGSRYSGYRDDNVERMTLIDVCVSYECWHPEELTTPDGKRWFRVRQYTDSGETECPMGSCGDNETVGEDSTEGMSRCPLCEADAGEKHGYIYLGTCVESVYVCIDFECEECKILQSEIRAWEEPKLCNCAFPDE